MYVRRRDVPQLLHQEHWLPLAGSVLPTRVGFGFVYVVPVDCCCCLPLPLVFRALFFLGVSMREEEASSRSLVRTSRYVRSDLDWRLSTTLAMESGSVIRR